MSGISALCFQVIILGKYIGHLLLFQKLFENVVAYTTTTNLWTGLCVGHLGRSQLGHLHCASAQWHSLTHRWSVGSQLGASQSCKASLIGLTVGSG